MKKFFAAIISLLLMANSSWSWGTTVMEDIEVYFKNIQISFNNQVLESKNEDEAFIYNNRVYVPLRTVSEGMDCIVDWDEVNNKVSIEEKSPLALLPPTDPFKGETFVYGEIMKVDYDGQLLEIEQHLDHNSRDVFETLAPTSDAVFLLKRNEHHWRIGFEDLRVGDVVGIVLTEKNEMRGIVVGD